MANKAPSKQDVDERLRQISHEVLPKGLRLAYVAVDELREQDVNARSMPQVMLDQLAANIKATGALESLPLCAVVDDRIEIVSGHHRVRAARTAGLTHILVLLYESISTSRLKAKQLAHNSISGKDDTELLARIWSEIDDVQARFEAFIDPRIVEALPDPVKFSPVDVDLAKAGRVVMVVFLPTQEKRFDAVLEAIVPPGNVEKAYLATLDEFEPWITALRRVKEDLEVVSTPTAMSKMAELAAEALARRSNEQEGDG